MSGNPDLKGNGNNFINPAKKHYHEMQTVYDNATLRTLVNVFISYALRENPELTESCGTMLAIHGFGGSASPVDTVIYTAKKMALKQGFDFVTIEPYDVSGTSREAVPESDFIFMKLARYRYAINEGVKVALRNGKLNRNYRILLGHCMASCAIVYNYLSRGKENGIFDEFLFITPYFVPELNVLAKRDKILSQDEDGRKWKNKKETFIISKEYVFEGQKYTFSMPLCSVVDEFLEDLPKLNLEGQNLDSEKYASDLFAKHSGIKNSLRNKMVTCILAGKDKIVNYNASRRFYDCLPIEGKSIIEVKDAEHDFDNVPEEYEKAIQIILERSKKFIRERTLLAKSLTFDLTI